LAPLKKSMRGQSVVEFALVVPLLLLIILGIVEFSRMFETLNVLTSAAREGARVAAVTAPDVGRAQTAARNVLTAGNVTETPSISVSGPNANSEITVTVRVTYTPITGYFIPGIHAMSIQRAATMRWEG
jgi:Flp pilus assembly protein TadG